MSGQAGGRGYLVQAVISVLDALNDRDWTECILEPNLGEDKIDLLLRSSGGDRVSQIKSSENAIGAAQARAWAQSLEAAYPGANRYELRLIGPVTSGAASVSPLGNVEIPVPEALNMGALLEQCAHRLDRYLRALDLGPTRPAARELLAEALATRLGTFSANGETLSREALETLLASWVAELLPPEASDKAPVPHQLPGAPADFVGRHEELAVLRKAAERDAVRVIVIRGMTGIGKSVLAARAAVDFEHRYPDGQVYLEIGGADLGPRPIPRLLTDVIQAFTPSYASSDDVSRCRAEFRTLLKGRRVLILADNADAANQVEELIPPTSDSLLIVTTQVRFDLPGAVSIDLDVLPEEEGKTFVQTIAPRVTDSAALLARICGYLPLAIRVAAGTLNARPDVSPDEFIVRLSGVSERAKLVRAALDVSLAHASDETKSFLTATAVFPMDFDTAAAAAVWGQSDDVTDAQIATVIDRHLITWDDKRERYSLHNLVRDYIAETADVHQFGLFATRHEYYYADLCSEVERLYRQGGETAFSALHLFDTESPNIAAGFFFSAENTTTDISAAEICTTFVRGLTHIMDLRLPPLARAQILIAGLEAAKQLGNAGLTVLHTGNLGRVYRELGELDLSIQCQEWVLKMATAEGHREDQAYAHHHIGLAMLDKGKFLTGVGHLEKSLELSRLPELGLKSLEATTLNNLGSAYLRVDRPAKALDYLRPALGLQQELSDPRMLALTLTNVATALVAGQTEPDFAIELLENALGIAEDLGDVRAQFAARQTLATALEQGGRPDDAIATAEAQYTEAVRVGYMGQAVDALCTIGDLHLAVGDVSSARASYEALMQIAHDRHDQTIERKALSALANLALHEGDKAGAIELLEQQLVPSRSLRDRAKVCIKLGELLAGEGNRERASTLWRQALEYYVSVNHEIVDDLRNRIRLVENAEVRS